MTPWAPPRLNSGSAVPLYYQLYEVLKEGIESGAWPEGRMASEPQLMRMFGVSRIVVRKALTIVEDDGQIVRIRGRGTFVAPRKLRCKIGGLCSHLAEARGDGLHILALDNRLDLAPPNIQSALGVGSLQPVHRITTLLTERSVPIAITYSHFAHAEGAAIAEMVKPGSPLQPNMTLADFGIDLAFNTSDIEISEACKFEAERLNIKLASTVLMASCTEYCKLGGAVRPLERARVIYRGEALRLTTESSEAEPIGIGVGVR